MSAANPASYLYVLGGSPYDYSQHFYARGNDGGSGWRSTAPDMETALRDIFGSMLIPGEAAGRRYGIFLPGVSTPHPSHEVIQVWSNEPGCVERSAAYGDVVAPLMKDSHLWGYVPHAGGISLGLLAEIHISEIAQYLPQPPLALTDAGDAQKLSPLGSLVATVRDRRLALSRDLTVGRIQTYFHQLKLEDVQEAMRTKAAELQWQLDAANLYLSGVKGASVLHRGERASAAEPYRVFQERTFVDLEIGLLANFDEMDFRDLEACDEWLLRTGHWRIMLPYQKCILVTRIRRDEKYYTGEDRLLSWFFNLYNMEHVVWIRDGERLTRLGCDVPFVDSVFPQREEAGKLIRFIQEHIWDSRHRLRNNEEEESEAPGIRPDAHERRTPLRLRRMRTKFASMEEWLTSELYTPALDREIADAAHEHLRKKQLEQAKFLLWLQGVVDNTSHINIPPGTDLSAPDVFDAHFVLVYEGDRALSSSSHIDAYERLRSSVEPGAQILIEQLKHRSDFKTPVHSFAEVELPRAGKITVPVVMFRRQKLRGRRWSDSPESSEVKTAEPIPLFDRDYSRPLNWMPVDIPAELAASLLADRHWKRAHQWETRMLARMHFSKTAA